MELEQIKPMSVLLKSISHPIRLRILCMLRDKELTVGDIHKEIKTTNANISQHLSILRNQGIIGFRKDSNFIYNMITDTRVIKLIDTMQKLFCS